MCLALLDRFLIAHQLLGPVDQADAEAAEGQRHERAEQRRVVLPVPVADQVGDDERQGARDRHHEPESDDELRPPLASAVDVFGVGVALWLDVAGLATFGRAAVGFRDAARVYRLGRGGGVLGPAEDAVVGVTGGLSFARQVLVRVLVLLAHDENLVPIQRVATTRPPSPTMIATRPSGTGP